MGDEFLEKNDYKKALSNYEKALALSAQNPIIQFKIAEIYRLSEDEVRAIAYYQNAIANDPNYIDAWYNLGLAQDENGDTEAAQKSFEKVISLDVNYSDGFAYYGLAQQFEILGKKSDAIRNYKIFIKRNKGKDPNVIATAQSRIEQLRK